jgi:tetratricopeptide (TPR) repeat protein
LSGDSTDCRPPADTSAQGGDDHPGGCCDASAAELAGSGGKARASGDSTQGVEDALTLHQSGRHDEAERIYRRLLEDAPSDPTVLYLYGMLSFETGRPDQAEALFDRLVEAQPGQAEGWFALANLRYWRDRHAAAVEAYRQAIALDAGHVGARFNLIQALRDGGRFDEAVEACRAALVLAADPAAFQTLLGGVLIAAGRSGEAATAFATACALNPADVEARLGLATALIGDGRPDEALSVAQAAIAADDSLAEAWMLRGAALTALRRSSAAAAALERAVELDPGRAAARLDLGGAYAALERAVEAEQQLLAALAIDPTLKEALACLGSVYMRSERWAQAERCFRLALDIDPEMVVPHQNLAGLMAEQDRPAEARRHRDLAYGRQSLFIERAPAPVQTVLMLTAAEGGNVPHRFLLPSERYTRLSWFIEYAAAEDAGRLPAYDLVFNAIGDPDLAAPIRPQLDRFLAACPAPVLNPPDKVARTFRHLTAGLLAGVEGIVAPHTVRLEADGAAGGLAARLAPCGLEAPVLLRPIGSHGGKGVIRVDDADALAALPSPDGDLYATAYHDFRSPDGWHRKYRVIFVDRRAYPYHLAISNDWLVHHGTAGMLDDAGRQAEELRFLADPDAAIGEAAMAAIRTVGERLDLDYGGIDFSVLPDGRVLVFEANAAMLVHPETEDGPLAGKNPFVHTILDAFAAMLAHRAAPKPPAPLAMA